MCGISSYLRLLFPACTVLGVDAHCSLIFGPSDAGDRRLLRGLGNSLLPPNVDHTAFDLVHWVGAAEGFQATRRLHREHALFMEPTSGAAYLVVHGWARQNPDALAAVVLPTKAGYRDPVHDGAWLDARGVRLDVLSPTQVEWNRPHDGKAPLSFRRWARRRFGDATRAPDAALERVA